jgi:hypothetical protein
MKKKLTIFYVALAMLITSVGIVYAAFADKGTYVGASFSVGSSDLRLLEHLEMGVIESNLKEELTGPTFANLITGWSGEYPIKLYNNGSTALTIDSRSNYETANDPASLRSVIYVDIADWNDINNDGTVNTDERGSSYGTKSITKWKTEGIDLGSIDKGTVKGFVLTFSTQTISDTLQGKSGIFDFEFNAVGQ